MPCCCNRGPNWTCLPLCKVQNSKKIFVLERFTMQKSKMGRKQCSKSARNLWSFHLAQTPLPVSRLFWGNVPKAHVEQLALPSLVMMAIFATQSWGEMALFNHLFAIDSHRFFCYPQIILYSICHTLLF